ncbi:MAG: dipeptide epimerase [Gammaproteobacteria bacterium]|nr:dipeptide epimerase [Gammaproteobacteria bacterium]
MTSLVVNAESWPIRGSFRISRGSKTSADVVTVILEQSGRLGRGECVPYARYGESIASVTGAIEALRSDIEAGMSRMDLQQAMPAGAARNAVDCAFWDLEAKLTGKRAWQLAGFDELKPLTTAYTLSLDSPEAMRQNAEQNAHMPLLKLKLAGPDDLARVAAVREGSPDARIIVDANEGWRKELYLELAPELQRLGVEMIEQPLPAGDDDELATLRRSVTVCADESCHDSGTLAGLIGKYDMLNIKLDKTGGLTEALKLAKAARRAGMQIMTGCMVATSLSMAPAMIVAQLAEVVDLDGPLLLDKDRADGLAIDNGRMSPPARKLWG